MKSESTSSVRTVSVGGGSGLSPASVKYISLGPSSGGQPYVSDPVKFSDGSLPYMDL